VFVFRRALSMAADLGEMSNLSCVLHSHKPINWLSSQKVHRFHSALQRRARQQGFHSREHIVDRFFIGTEKTAKN
jgi:hypothetical protein